MVYKLAAPSRMKDISWIRPGKVAWEWWNHWGIKGVDFEAGINNETYMHYIDFASRHGIEYVILDEGWAVNLKADLFQIVPEIDLKKAHVLCQAKECRTHPLGRLPCLCPRHGTCMQALFRNGHQRIQD